jgi:hypothetical protein
MKSALDFSSLTPGVLSLYRIPANDQYALPETLPGIEPDDLPTAPGPSTGVRKRPAEFIEVRELDLEDQVTLLAGWIYAPQRYTSWTRDGNRFRACVCDSVTLAVVAGPTYGNDPDAALLALRDEVMTIAEIWEDATFTADQATPPRGQPSPPAAALPSVAAGGRSNVRSGALGRETDSAPLTPSQPEPPGQAELDLSAGVAGVCFVALFVLLAAAALVHAWGIAAAKLGGGM